MNDLHRPQLNFSLQISICKVGNIVLYNITVYSKNGISKFLTIKVYEYMYTCLSTRYSQIKHTFI